MLITFIIYSILFLYSFACSIALSRHDKNTVYLLHLRILFPILFCAIILGSRFEVGTDWFEYKRIYEDANILHLFNSGIEPLYILLNRFILSFNAHYAILFFTIILIQLLLFYKSLEKYYFLLPYIIFFFFTSGLLFSFLNIQRQAIAFCIFLYAIKYAINRNTIKYFICVLIAFLFHYSAIILSIIYLISSRRFAFLDKQGIKFILYLLSFFALNVIIQSLQWLIPLFTNNGKYMTTLNVLGQSKSEFNSGYGILFLCLIDILFITYSKRLSKYFNSNSFNILFRIYFFGIILSNAAWNDLFLQRLTYYFIGLRFLMASFFTYYAFHTWKINSTQVKFSALGLISIYVLLFIVSIMNGTSGCSPFQFIKF